MIEAFTRAIQHEQADRRDLGLDVLWDTLGVAIERLEFKSVAQALTDFYEALWVGTLEPEPFVLLGALMISLPIKEVDVIKTPRKNLFEMTVELFGEWQWDTTELMDME